MSTEATILAPIGYQISFNVSIIFHEMNVLKK